MKTRKKTLFLSMLGVFLFTAGCMLLNTIDKVLNRLKEDGKIDKYVINHTTE